MKLLEEENVVLRDMVLAQEKLIFALRERSNGSFSFVYAMYCLLSNLPRVLRLNSSFSCDGSDRWLLLSIKKIDPIA